MYLDIDNGLSVQYTPYISIHACLVNWRRLVRDDELIVPPHTGELVWLKGLAARYIIAGEQTGGRLSIVEHPIKPKALASPMHTHSHEDEISFVIEGQVGIQIGDRIV